MKSILIPHNNNLSNIPIYNIQQFYIKQVYNFIKDFIINI